MACNFSFNCKKFKNGTCEELTCIRKFKIDSLLNKCLLTDKQKKDVKLYLDKTESEQSFETLSRIKENIERFVTGGNNLYIYSSHTGNGKTSWSLKLLREYILKIWYKCDISTKCLYINVPRFLIELKNSISVQSDYIDTIKENVLTCDLVVFDDIATKSMTEYECENLLSIINTRIEEGKSIVFTSNILPKDLEKYVGARLASRILCSMQVELTGLDKRGFV